MKKQSGFTVIEIVTVVLFLAVAAVVLFMQLATISRENRNEQQKTAINAIYFSLEEGFYAKNGYYPAEINDKTLPTMDAALLEDPNGVMIGDGDSLYRYEPTDCHEGKCRSYSLRTTLDGEADFIKESRGTNKF